MEYKGIEKATAKVKVVQLDEVKDFLSEDEDSPPPQSTSPPPHMMVNSVSLNPHKALQALGGGQKPDESTHTVLGSEAMRNIRGAIGRKSSTQNGRKTRLSPGDLPLQVPPPQVIRERTASRSGDRDVIARKCRISNSFIELERLLDITSKKSRAEVLEFSVRHIKSLQKCINEAGERNSDLHDMVESISLSARPNDSRPIPSPDSSLLSRVLPPRNRRDIKEARLSMSKVPPFTSVDTFLMSFVGLAANIAPVEFSNPVVDVTLHGVCKWLVRVVSIIVVVIVVVKYLHREKMFTFRKVLASLLALGSSTSCDAMHPGGMRPQHLSDQRTLPSARSRSSSSSSYPRAHIVAPLMRKIYSAEDLEASAVPNQAIVAARSRAISNPVIPLSRPPTKRPVTLNHHHHNLQSGVLR
eukprot:TRINITY_DN36800_c0_g1_i1.p1 TRINITY_DN36800_c0_g1~~TRINITY_DN36800_c0_g1_i1.p1  ORF type:complete len:413 (+),score=75.61 TRINITY_DN36800_c0_g1_i1:116-1354(+)